MKKIILSLLALTLSISSCKKVEVEETETIPTPNEVVVDEAIVETPLDSATIAKAWTDYATPSKAHEMLAKDTGTWDADMTFWMPESPEPQKAKSVATYKMILDGKYQEGIFKGDMWGMPFEGRGLTAYDNASKEFITTWIDNMGTGMLVSRGQYDEASKSITFSGNMVDPVTGKEKKVKEVITYIDDKNQKMEMFEVNSDGTEFKNMEILSKKR
ncbi:DUF1579 domain-containing protein [uncultured Flavobacterium sp.]|uniref:DUF1579 domain-containing protein n=1 Tax=uncultured Flavobacterium sp. TaxID=165435 RepID=UPI0030EB4E3B|tara:strand:+ start:61103 stop:61747 length:645 start_codon:yes stop_codon:yes gene_type:complete